MTRLAAALAVNGGLLALAYLVALALFGRPLFAAALVACGWLLVALVSSAKQRALREPLVFADFGLFSQALRHPRLYLPYFGTWRAALAAAGAAALFAAGWLIEDAARLPLAAWVALFASGAALLAAGSAAGTLTLEPKRDVERYGLLASLWLYWLAERRAPYDASAPFAAAVARRGVRMPIVVVQSESFFDVRRLDAGIDPGVLANFDALSGTGQSGRLGVPVWGAYTMRTEFAFLSGIAPERLGVHRFNPYRRFARRPVATLASLLRSLGYRTVCIHPYPASFFGRDRVFPLLGFDEFVDLAAFGPARRAGPYVADAEVAEKILSELKTATPVFVFAITMENHGPLHLEAVAPDDARLYRLPPPAGFEDLTVYLRHLRNADAMLGALGAELARRGEGVLCWYGDHVPSMPGVYAALGYEDPRTDYCLWRPGRAGPARADLQVEALALGALNAAGLASAPG